MVLTPCGATTALRLQMRAGLGLPPLAWFLLHPGKHARAARPEKGATMTTFTITPGPSLSILRGLTICALSLGIACLLTLQLL